MHVIRRRGWEIPERLVTPEYLFFNRRAFLAGVSTLVLLPVSARAQQVSDLAKLPDPTADLYPANHNDKYVLDRPITNEQLNAHYNNFYEFNSSKDVADQAQKLNTRPWVVKIDGLVEKPMEVGIDELIRQMTLEERAYRHRCVEAWSMAIVWTGFPFAKLVDFARPLGSAKYHGPKDCAGRAHDLVPLALYRRPHHGRGDERTCLPSDRCLWAPIVQATRRAVEAGGAVEIRLQVHQVDRALHVHGETTEGLLGSAAGVRIRLLGERQSRSAAPALESGNRGSDRYRGATTDAPV